MQTIVLTMILILAFPRMNANSVSDATTLSHEEYTHTGMGETRTSGGYSGSSRDRYLKVSGVFTGVTALTVLAGMQMWKWGSTVHFKAHPDGWFERTQTHGGADKVGHAWMMFVAARGATAYFRTLYPSDSRTPAYLGALLSVFMGVGIEIGDGFATDYGFSYTDLVFDLLGTAIALGMELWPWFDDLIDFSVWAVPTPGFLTDDNPNRFDIATDYSGHLVTVHLRLGGIPQLRHTLMEAFRVDLGYFTKCYQPYDRCSYEMTGTHRYETRNIYFGISLDMARLIEKGGGPHWLGVFSRYYNLWGFFPTGLNMDLNHGGKISPGLSTPLHSE